jgi:anti-sigma-K factor RskA
MTCDEVDTHLPEYALGIASERGAGAVREHLASCRRHHATLCALSGVVERLPSTVEERAPPPGLRARLLQSFDAEVASRDDRAPPAVLAPRRTPRWPAPPAYLAAAVLVAALAGLLAWNLVLQLSGSSGEDALVASIEGAAGGGRLVYLEDEQRILLELDLVEPPPDRVYQAWTIANSEPSSLGIVPPEGVRAFDANLTGVDIVAITAEPPGGSFQPTGEPLAVARIDE